jgi:NCS1 family nucleobase:cation symporter-1
MFGIIIADYYLVKCQQIVLDDLYTMSSSGSLYYQDGWNPAALVALGAAGLVSIGLALLGAYGIILNVGDWGWLIGATLGGLLYLAGIRSFGERQIDNAQATATVPTSARS